jgi:protein phosphatase
LFHACDREIFQTSEKVLHDQEMGTTLTAAFIKSGTVYWAHAGDSRLYLWRGGILTQITADDTPAAFLVGEGKLTNDEARLHPARHGLFECLGRGVLELQSGEFAVRQGDLLLLTSDGLHGEISEDVIRSILKFDLDLDGRVGQLINKAKEAGGSDNITAIGIEI